MFINTYKGIIIIIRTFTVKTAYSDIGGGFFHEILFITYYNLIHSYHNITSNKSVCVTEILWLRYRNSYAVKFVYLNIHLLILQIRKSEHFLIDPLNVTCLEMIFIA